MATAQTTNSNPLRDLGNALIGKAMEFLPSVLGVTQQPTGGKTNLSETETKGNVTKTAEDKPWYQDPKDPAMWIAAGVVVVVLWIVFKRT
jgi:hypothetical protein